MNRLSVCVSAVSFCLSTMARAASPQYDDPEALSRPVAGVQIDNMAAPHQDGDTEWPTYNRQPGGQRYSDLHSINAGNVTKLKEICRTRLGGVGPFSSGLVLADGALFATTAHSTTAINPTNCAIIWKALYVPEQTEVMVSNRGVGVAEGRVFRGTGDGRLLAYDAGTGKELWRIKVGMPDAGEYISSAPLVWEGKVFVGLAGADWGIQGRMMAFDAATGRMLWSFNTVPHPGEFGNDSWAGDSWKHGGGATWSSYALDTATHELFVPVANPAPAWNPSVRRGDNLFTDSVLVLNADTGKLLWYFQTRKGDSHDADIAAPPVLFSFKNGAPMVALGSKDGSVYLVDRRTHQQKYKTAVTTILNDGSDPKSTEMEVCPGAEGGIDWNGPAYDPVNVSLTVGAVDWCSIYVAATPVYDRGKLYLGGKIKQGRVRGGWLTSLDAETGKVRWKFRSEAPFLSAVTPTAGGITFAGDMNGVLYAFRSSDGAVLKQIDTGGAIAGGIITYASGGKQFVATTSGNLSRLGWPMGTGFPTIVIFALADDRGGVDGPGSVGALGQTSDEAIAHADKGRGEALYSGICASCHGASGEGGTGPELRGVSTVLGHDRLVDLIKRPRSPMPALWPKILTDQDVADVAAYVAAMGTR